MPTQAETNRAQFADSFNRILGNKIGKPIVPYTDAQLANSVSTADTNAAQLTQAKQPAIKLPKAASTGTGIPKAKTSASSVLGTKSKAAPVVNPIATPPQPATPKVNTSAGGLIDPIGWFHSVKHALGNAAEYVGLTDKQDPHGTAGQALNTVGHSINNSVPAQVAASGIKRTLDVAERPFYGIMEGSRNLAQGINQGDSGWSLPKDFVTGAWHGVEGQKKTGFGQVVQEAGPNLPMPVKRLAGAVGDVALDPVTYASGGSDIAAKEATNAGLRAGLEATGKDAIKHEVGRVAEDVIGKTSALDDLKLSKGIDTKAITDSIISEVKDKLDTIAYDTKKGQMVGGGARDMHGTISQTLAETVRDKYIQAIEQPKSEFLKYIDSGKRYTPEELAAIRTKDPLFSKWLDGANQAIKEESALGKPIQASEIAKLADAKFSAILSPKMDEIYAKTLAQLDDIVMRVPKVNFMHQTAYLPRVGKALDAVKGSVGNRFENLNKAFNMSSWLPGYTGHIAAKMKSVNKLAFDEFKTNVEEAFRGLTPIDRKEIKYATENGTVLTGKRGEAQAFFEQANRDMFNQEVGQGVRNPEKTPYASDYAFNKVTKGSNNLKDFNAEWRDARKAAVLKNGSTAGFTGTEAAAKGLHVENDAAASLIYRKMKSINMLSKTYLEKDLLTHYGIASAIPEAEAKARNLIKVDDTRQPWLKDVLKPGQSAYLDKDIAHVMKNYSKLTSFRQTDEANNLIKSIEKATQIFKTANTIYWPGFHLRNAVSDIFMGALDGVKSKDYGTIGRAMFNRDKAFLKVGDESVPFSKIYDSYYKNAASGFIDSELNIRTPKTDLSTTRFMDAIHSPSAFNAKLRDMSQVREDFGRLVHYYHALNDEYTHLITKGVSKDAAWKGAEEAAIFRVNKYKFDYSALTPFEQKIRAYGMPFYTYMRKATPVLVENLFMNPRYFAYINKLQKALAPSQDFTANNLPQWMHDQSYSQLSSSGTHEPWGFTDALSPIRTLTDSFRNPVVGANPVIQAGFELNSGKDTFTGKAVNSLSDVLANKWKGTTQWKSAVGGKASLEKWATFTGIPLYQVTQARQDGRTKQLTAEVSKKVQTINKQITNKGYKVSVRHNQIYLVKPKTPTTKELVVGVYDTFAEIPLSKL